VIAVRKCGPYPELTFNNTTKAKKGKEANEFESWLRSILNTKSRFRTDGGTIEGVVLRIDDANGKWLEHRMKIVRPDFTHGITEHWTRREVEKQTADLSFAVKYCSTEDYSLAAVAPPPQQSSPPSLEDPKNVPDDKVVAVRYKHDEPTARETMDPRKRLVILNICTKEIVLPRNFSFL